MRSSGIAERIIVSHYHSTCAECRMPIIPGAEVRYLPRDERHGRLRAHVRHAEGQCPPVMDYAVQLLYRCTSKTLRVRALTASEAIEKARPKRTAWEVDLPCGYVVRQGNVEVLRRAV